MEAELYAYRTFWVGFSELYDYIKQRIIVSQLSHSFSPFIFPLVLCFLCLLCGIPPSRRLYFLDRNRDLYLAQALKGGAPGTVVKLLGMVDSAAWHSTQDLLVAVADGTHHAFICPAAYYQVRLMLKHKTREISANMACFNIRFVFFLNFNSGFIPMIIILSSETAFIICHPLLRLLTFLAAVFIYHRRFLVLPLRTAISRSARASAPNAV